MLDAHVLVAHHARCANTLRTTSSPVFIDGMNKEKFPSTVIENTIIILLFDLFLIYIINNAIMILLFTK